MLSIRRNVGVKRCFLYFQKSNFSLPSSYKPNSNNVKKLPFAKSFSWWWKSLNPNRLKILQDQLLDLMISPKNSENSQISWENKRVKINVGDGDNYINEVSIELVDPSNVNKPIKHVVFVHGYGAALGCFARNFQVINLLKDMNYNYKIHFLDNISFGLSSNPDLLKLSKRIPKCVELTMNDPDPTDPKKLYNKYYKLIDSYSIDLGEFDRYREKFFPILRDIENYYTSAIDQWRISSGIDKIDYLIGHSYGGHWSASYSVRYPEKLKHLILLSPVGVERHVQAVTNPIRTRVGQENEEKRVTLTPSLDPQDFNFLSRWPILSSKHIFNWYHVQPKLPKLLKWFGPWGVNMYYAMWYSKLFKINRLIDKRGGAEKLFQSSNDLVYGTNEEIHLLIEYLYNNMSKSSVSDIYIKHLLTPSTVSKWPLYDKFLHFLKDGTKPPFDLHIVYGQFDFMNSEAGKLLVKKINELADNDTAATYGEIDEGGHNLYIDNPFQMNERLKEIFKKDD
ncbi:protein Ecm18p [[Candida] railenensis]|uniref:Protein Ecm18p n=1 Tax=[Candida] railenensis TaxID=45579 RepID=A0A9P0QN81_9ASCO|nr:protein Ecm18p [[Candida] railenensis]